MDSLTLKIYLEKVQKQWNYRHLMEISGFGKRIKSASKRSAGSGSSTPGWISSPFVQTWCIWTPLQCLKAFSWEMFGVSQNGRRRPQKGKTSWNLLHLGHYRPWNVGWHIGNPMKVNISWIMVNFAEYHGGLGPPWQALRACSPWSPGVNGLLKYKSPYWANPCDHCHLVYRQENRDSAQQILWSGGIHCESALIPFDHEFKSMTCLRIWMCPLSLYLLGFAGLLGAGWHPFKFFTLDSLAFVNATSQNLMYHLIRKHLRFGLSIVV